MVADIGFWVKPNQKAAVSAFQISNLRKPFNVLFEEKPTSVESYTGIFKKDMGKKGPLAIQSQHYHLSGGKSGALILADPSKTGTPMLRTVFKTQNKPIAKARLFVTARGIYEMYLNGNRIGDDFFNPGLTQYNKHHMYQAYDISLSPNQEHALGAWLGEGWWSGNITYSGENWNYFGDRQSLMAKLLITYADGSEQVVTTQPETWKVNHAGPIRYASFFQGEVYDARLDSQIQGWASLGFDDSKWSAAAEVPLQGSAFIDPQTNPQSGEIIRGYDQMELLGQLGANAKIVKTLPAQSVEEVRPGVFVYDMGQNMVGFPHIVLPAGNAGDTVRLRYSEVRYPDLPEHKGLEGMIMIENIRAALTQDLYIRKGGIETIQPRFTFHGYRFLEITGVSEALPMDQVQGLVVSSIDRTTAHYETSNPLVNKLWENITWSMRGNFLSIPTDTPARNERMGWSGDINVFSRTATYMGQVQNFLSRHLMAMRDIQRPDGRFPDVAPVGGGFGGTLWGSAGVIVPWEVYQQYADTSLLEIHYPSMKAYMTFLDARTNEQGILNEGPLGDWLSPENLKNDNTLLWTAYHIYCLDIMQKGAQVLGKTEESSAFGAKAQERREFFNRTYIDKETGKTIKSGFQAATVLAPNEQQSTAAGKVQWIDTQASYAIGLDMGAFSAENEEKAVSLLLATIERPNKDDGGVERPPYSLMTGFIGTASISTALSANGQHAAAYRLLQQTSYPSWLYSVVNGATTIWERLNSYTVENGFGGNNSMNSFNHYSFGAVGAWMMNYSLGIQRDLDYPGFKHFVLRPTPDPDRVMTWANGHYDSMYGRIESSWKIGEGMTEYEFSIPANTSAKVYLPADSYDKVSESGMPLGQANGVSLLGIEDGQVKLRVQSGEYRFVVRD
jgi:alpha-L-rhamnosidase